MVEIILEEFDVGVDQPGVEIIMVGETPSVIPNVSSGSSSLNVRMSGRRHRQKTGRGSDEWSRDSSGSDGDMESGSGGDSWQSDGTGADSWTDTAGRST